MIFRNRHITAFSMLTLIVGGVFYIWSMDKRSISIAQDLSEPPVVPCPKGTPPDISCIKVDGFVVPDIGALTPPPLPNDPKHTAKIKLGESLFCNNRLSLEPKYGCASCHLSKNWFSDSADFSSGDGGRRGARNTPTLLNVVFRKHLFWDGRARNLEEQVLFPVTHPDEMHTNPIEIVQKVRDYKTDDGKYLYRDAFHESFGIPAHFWESTDPTGIVWPRITEAIAVFEQSLISGNSPFDRYMHELEEAKKNRLPPRQVEGFGEAEKRGMALFRKEARCILCHNGSNFTDNDVRNPSTEVFHRVGYIGNHKVNRALFTFRDLGRYDVTGDEKDRLAFTTPTLRNVAKTKPYMHDGSLNGEEGLRLAVEFFYLGGSRSSELDPQLKARAQESNDTDQLDARLKARGPMRNIDRENISDLLAFLKALTDPHEEAKECAFGES